MTILLQNKVIQSLARVGYLKALPAVYNFFFMSDSFYCNKYFWASCTQKPTYTYPKQEMYSKSQQVVWIKIRHTWQ